MLLKELIKKGTEAISSAYPEREAREMVLSYLEDYIGTKRHTHIIEPGYLVEDVKAEACIYAFARMAAGEPLQYVTGYADFYGRRFRVTPDVLIPRPETEVLCREVLGFLSRTISQFDFCVKSSVGTELHDSLQPLDRYPQAVEILDLCTGSGCIAWTLALEMPGAEVTAADISDGALSVASSQDFSDEISRTGASAPHFLKADVLAGPEQESLPQYDILVSNPPYVMDKEKALMRTNVLDHEPHLALFVPDEDPLVFYRAIVRWALACLKPEGYGIVEINEVLGPETAALFVSAGFRNVNIIADLSDRPRFVSFRR